MEESINGKVLWDLASKAGLALGAVSSAYALVSPLVAINSSSVILNLLGSLLGIVLWVAKFFGCIWLMKFFMRRLCSEHRDADNSHTRRLGIMAAALSALVYSAFYFAYVSFINPELFSNAIDTIMESYSSMLSSDDISQIENIRGDLGPISFITNLIYCFLYGCVLSLIVSRNIPDSNPFNQDNQSF